MSSLRSTLLAISLLFVAACPKSELLQDGTQVSLTGNAALDVPTSFSQLRVGLYNYQQVCSPYLVAWIDEIALDTNRIGCGN